MFIKNMESHVDAAYVVFRVLSVVLIIQNTKDGDKNTKVCKFMENLLMYKKLQIHL